MTWRHIFDILPLFFTSNIITMHKTVCINVHLTPSSFDIYQRHCEHFIDLLPDWPAVCYLGIYSASIWPTRIQMVAPWHRIKWWQFITIVVLLTRRSLVCKIYNNTECTECKQGPVSICDKMLYLTISYDTKSQNGCLEEHDCFFFYVIYVI